jgi:hypothetical protein
MPPTSGGIRSIAAWMSAGKAADPEESESSVLPESADRLAPWVGEAAAPPRTSERPSSKPVRFVLTATPLRSMALRNASSMTGNAPAPASAPSSTALASVPCSRASASASNATSRRAAISAARCSPS